MENLRYGLIRSIQNKRVNVLLFFFFIAFLFSILTKLSNSYTKTFEFQLQLQNIPEEKVVLTDSTHKLAVTLTATGFGLLPYYFSDHQLEIDLLNVESHRGRYLWIKEKQLPYIIDQFDSKMEVNVINPDTVIFNYDNHSVKRVPVVLNQDIQFQEGFDVLKSYQLRPDSVRVIGPEAFVKEITAVETHKVKLENVNTNIRLSVGLSSDILPSEVKLSQDEVSIYAEVEKFTEGSRQVPISIVNVPKKMRLKYYPKTVEVVFYTSLKHYNSITSEDFVVECRYDPYKEEAYLVPKIVKQPNNVKNLRLNTKRIEFIVTQ